MKLSTIFLIAFLLLYGIFAVSNLRIEWGEPIKDYSALLAGIFLFVDLVRGR